MRLASLVLALALALALPLAGCVLAPDEATDGEPTPDDCAGPEVVQPDDPCFDDTNQTGDPYAGEPPGPRGHIASADAPA